MQTACPQCRNPGFAIHARNQLRCGRCNHVWEQTLAYPALPGPVFLPASKTPSVNFRSDGGRGRAALWVAGVLLVVFVAGFWLATGAMNEAHRDDALAPAPRAVRSPELKIDIGLDTPPPIERPKVKPGQLTSSRFEGRNGNYRYWVLQVSNPHDTQIEPQKITVTPANGEAFDRYSMSMGIPSGQNVWMLVVYEDKTEQEHTFTLTPIPHAYAHNMPLVTRLPLKDLAVDEPAPDTYQRAKIKGKVHNNTDATVDRMFVQAIGLDAQRNPVAFAETYLSDPIAPRGEVTFTISTGTYEIAKPARWEVQAFGTSKR